MLRRTTYLLVPAVIALVAVLFGHTAPVVGYPVAADVTVTVSSHALVHRTGGDGCYVRAPQTYRMTVLSPSGQHSAVLGPGRLFSDGACGFSATLPAMPDASAVVVNGGLHMASGAVGTLTLNSDDGRWSPLMSGAL